MIGYARLGSGDTRYSLIISPLVFVVYLSGPSVYRASHGCRPAAADQPTTAAAGLRYSTENHSHFSADASPSRLLALSDRYAGDGRGMTLCGGRAADRRMDEETTL